jgi:hypothetical protein
MKALHFVLMLACVFVTAPAQAREPLADQVKTAINNGVRYLRDIENGKGSFEHTTVIARVRPGGVTALATVALLQCGVPVDDPLIQRCLKYLRTLPPSQTYTVGLQTMAFCIAGQKEDRQLVQRNLDWLKDTHSDGGWGYEASVKSPDHSINQYALLGIHEAHLAGFTVDPALLNEMHRTYYARPGSGQWHYRGAGRASLTMTTAGLCNLLITAQDLSNKKALTDRGIDLKCGKYVDDRVVTTALDFIADEFPGDIKRTGLMHPFYALYGIERAGRLTGRRFFGEKDWYRIGCEYLVSIQKTNGSWEGQQGGNFDYWPPVSSSFALLFLSKGRTPVLISKLALQDGDEWNNKRSDARHVTEFCSRELFERQPLAWQVFNTRFVPRERKATELAEELLQSPIVYITGHNLRGIVGSRDEEMLKQFVANGGFILGHACCGGCKETNDEGVNFDRQFRELIKRITGSELGRLGTNHPVWNVKYKLSDKDDSVFGLEGVNVGCKTVVMYLRQPLSAYWENNDVDTPKGKPAFQLAANIVAYATGMQMPKPRLTEVEIVRESEGKKPPRGYMEVAQIVPSRGAIPLAPKAIPNLMLELGKLQMEVSSKSEPITVRDRSVIKYKFLYFHDRVPFRVPAPEHLDYLRFTLEHDGLLLADAACGSKGFDKSFRDLVEALWPKDKYRDRQLVSIDVKANQAKNELYSKEVNGTAIESVKYRREEKDGTPSTDYQDGPPRLEGVKINGRWVIIYSKYDIGCALEKHQSTECLGHDHDSAKLLARAVVLYALRR